MRNRTPRPSDSVLRALPLSHREFTVNEVYYEVHVTRVLHIAMISNVFFEYESDFRSNEHYLSSSENKA